MRLIAFTDGGSRGNPGPAALGVYITDEQGRMVKEHGRYLGTATNNHAEYAAVIDALEHAKQLGADELDMFMDSELVVRQLSGQYRVKDPGLAQQYMRVHNLRLGFRKVTFTHVRREKNKEADRLVNETLDRHLQA